MYWLRSRVHPTWHFACWCAGICIGVYMSQWQAGFSHAAWVFAGLGMLVITTMFRRRWLLIVALVGGVVVGLWRGAGDEQAAMAYRATMGQHVRIAATVMQDPSPGVHGRQTVVVSNVTVNDKSHAPGNVRVIVSEAATIRRGDKVVVDGIVTSGISGAMATIDKTSLVKIQREDNGNVALAIRDAFAAGIRQALSEPAASLGIGILLGQKQGLPSALADALRIVGLTHIVVASGYNLMILVRFARRLFEAHSAYLATFVGAVLIASFIAITGLSPSMTRAGLVAAIGLVAWYLGKKFHPVTLLLLAAAMTLMYSPSYAWGDVGWLLSFTSFVGVLVLAPVLTAYFYEDAKPGWLARLLIETGSALLMTLPISVVVFGKWSVLALVANALILPAIPLAMALTFVAGIGALLIPAAAHIVGWPANTLLDAIRWVTERLAAIDGAQIDVSMGWWFAVVWWVAMLIAMGYMKWRTKFHLRARGGGADDENLV